MREEKWLREKWIAALGVADEKYVEEADPVNSVSVGKSGRKRARRMAALAACFAVLVLGGLVLFVPFRTTPPDVSRYVGSEYYPLIEQINELTYEKPRYKNNFEVLASSLGRFVGGALKMDDKESSLSGGSGSDGSLDTYREVTDNQVEGVTEADRIKRSDRYIYYLDIGTLKVFTVDQENSVQVGAYDLSRTEYEQAWADEWEFYLSGDCRTVTILKQRYCKETQSSWLDIVALDVSDPANIQEKAAVSISGSYVSSRVTDGRLLLMMQFAVGRQTLDFDDPSTFLPQIERDGRVETFPMDQIAVPEILDEARYTTVLVFDEGTLEMKGAQAFLSYSQEVYVSAGHVFLTHTYARERNDHPSAGVRVSDSYTQISCLSYGDQLEQKGSVTVRGYIKDQYSMDEYEGLLRVVTTTSEAEAGESIWNRVLGGSDAEYAEIFIVTNSNASLYCIDLASWEIVGKMEDFAPEGEEVRSVRFDGDSAYVCTSVRVQDPVFFFDLSDPEHIRCKDTGTIPGFSTSLVNFGWGRLLGIGRGEMWNSFKAEIYEETADSVLPLCSYEVEDGRHSDDYKAYYIDRENQLLGLGINENYVVLLFDGYQLRKVAEQPLGGRVDFMRGVYIDGYMYLFGEEDFAVVRIFAEKM